MERVFDGRALLQEFRVRTQTEIGADLLPAALLEEGLDDRPRRPGDDGALDDDESHVALRPKGGPDFATPAFDVAPIDPSVAPAPGPHGEENHIRRRAGCRPIPDAPPYRDNRAVHRQ